MPACKTCDGTGAVWLGSLGGLELQEPCPSCKGSGEQGEVEYAYCDYCEDTRPVDHKCYAVPANLNIWYEPGTGEDGE